MLTRFSKCKWIIVTVFAAGCGVNAGLTSRSQSAEGYDAAKPILDHYCIGCHSGPMPSGHLRLDAYPFASSATSDQKVILDKIVARTQDVERPMPPASVVLRPTAADLDVLVSWQLSW